MNSQVTSLVCSRLKRERTERLRARSVVCCSAKKLMWAGISVCSGELGYGLRSTLLNHLRAHHCHMLAVSCQRRISLR